MDPSLLDENIHGSREMSPPKPEVEPIEIIDHVAEKKLVRKLDLHIIPIVMLLVNIGNARLYGLEADLGMKSTGSQYQTAVSLLFVTYILSEVPSNLVLKKFTPSRWIAFITTSWGIVATLTGVVQSYGGLIVCRLLLGAVEGGLFPGLALYLTIFYTKQEIALRVGYLFVSAALAGACGGLLGYGIGFMDGVSGQRGWRWIMIIEGLPTLVLGIASWFILANNPESASYLSDREKQLMTIRRGRHFGQTKSAQELHRNDVFLALKDWKIYAFCAGQFGTDTMLYGYSTFLPTIIKGLGDWSTAEIQVLTIPCYCLGAISYMVVAWISDAQQKRGLYSATFGVISVIGYAILISDSSVGVHYFGCFLVAMGLYVIVGIPIAWLPSNQPRYGKRATATGLQLTFGNCSGIMAPFLYKTYEGPRYVRGHAVTLSLVAFAILVYASMSLVLSRENSRRQEGKEDARVANKSDEEIEELGDASPRFRYTI
ncbi:hypothetical protein MMC29_006202 [Sticta canariensis]|nr:hypothetical protein [Sticta canariensis]